MQRVRLFAWFSGLGLASLTPVACGHGESAVGPGGASMNGGVSASSGAAGAGSAVGGAGQVGAGISGESATAGEHSSGGDAGNGGEAGMPSAAGGQSGSAGTTGSSGQAGASSGGGSSGHAGSSGAAGISGQAGASGAAGISGQGGSAGAVAGSSGQGGSAGGSSGAGAGGFAGSNQTPVASCAEACVTDSDCRVSGVDQGFVCNRERRRCETFARPCRADLECVAGASLWFFPCNSDSDCILFSDDVCVDAGGVGRCARLAPANGCEYPTPDALTVPKLRDPAPVVVCANTSRMCDAGQCRNACRSDGDCRADRNGSVCDVASGVCRCVRNEDCGGPGVSVCDVSTGSCKCANAADCTDVPNADACVAGRCGCSGVSACNEERAFSGTTYVCE